MGYELHRFCLRAGHLEETIVMGVPEVTADSSDLLAWRRLPPAARIYVVAVLVAGTAGSM